MNNRQIKDFIYENISLIGKAVSAPKRLELLEFLCQGEKTVEDSALHTGISLKLASAHLKVLRGARLVTTRKEGTYVYYRVANQEVIAFWVKLHSLAEGRFSEIEHTLKQFGIDPENMSKLDKKTLLKNVREGEVIIIDVRPEEEYLQGHIPNSLSIPFSELKKRLSEIPKSKEIIAYCRGPYCILSHEAALFLRKKGYKATPMREGMPEWMAAGLPVQKENHQ